MLKAQFSQIKSSSQRVKIAKPKNRSVTIAASQWYKEVRKATPIFLKSTQMSSSSLDTAQGKHGPEEILFPRKAKDKMQTHDTQTKIAGDSF